LSKRADIIAKNGAELARSIGQTIPRAEDDIRPRIDPRFKSDPNSLTVPLRLVYPDSTQPRKQFPSDMIAERAASLLAMGQLNPLLVVWDTQPEDPSRVFMVIDGECRYRAADEILHWPDIWVNARYKGPFSGLSGEAKQSLLESILLQQLASQKQRRDWSPIEEANAIARLIDQQKGFRLTVRDIVDRTGISQTRIQERVTLLGLPHEVRALVQRGQLYAKTAIVVAELPSDAMQIAAAEMFARGNWSTRRAKEWVKEKKEKLVRTRTRGRENEHEHPSKSPQMQKRTVHYTTKDGAGKITIHRVAKDEGISFVEQLRWLKDVIGQVQEEIAKT
jgi:ParB family chromosome partitioning protein